MIFLNILILLTDPLTYYHQFFVFVSITRSNLYFMYTGQSERIFFQIKKNTLNVSLRVCFEVKLVVIGRKFAWRQIEFIHLNDDRICAGSPLLLIF